MQSFYLAAVFPLMLGFVIYTELFLPGQSQKLRLAILKLSGLVLLGLLTLWGLK